MLGEVKSPEFPLYLFPRIVPPVVPQIWFAVVILEKTDPPDVQLLSPVAVQSCV
ncbi:hypothetical protein D3C87_1728430 [compost metagenome]